MIFFFITVGLLLFVILVIVKAESNIKKSESTNIASRPDEPSDVNNVFQKSFTKSNESQLESELVMTNLPESQINSDRSSQDAQWYYVHKGKRKGPFRYNEVQRLVEEGVIKRDTLIWHVRGDWIAASHTELNKFFASPPPLPGSSVSNRLPWLVVLVPIVGAIVELLAGVKMSTGIEVMLPYLAANTLLCAWDERNLKKAGHDAPSVWWVFLVPVYLWKRAKKLNQKRLYFWAWIFALILSMFVPHSEAAIPEAAIPVVNQVLQENLGDSAQKCVSVRIESKTFDEVFGIYGVYKGKAVLEDGVELTISVKDLGYTIYVEVDLFGY